MNFKFLVTITDDRFVFCRYKIGNWSRSMSRGEMTSPWDKKMNVAAEKA